MVALQRYVHSKGVRQPDGSLLLPADLVSRGGNDSSIQSTQSSMSKRRPVTANRWKSICRLSRPLYRAANSTGKGGLDGQGRSERLLSREGVPIVTRQSRLLVRRSSVSCASATASGKLCDCLLRQSTSRTSRRGQDDLFTIPSPPPYISSPFTSTSFFSGHAATR